jgi:hypothetical protein
MRTLRAYPWGFAFRDLRTRSRTRRKTESTRIEMLAGLLRSIVQTSNPLIVRSSPDTTEGGMGQLCGGE